MTRGEVVAIVITIAGLLFTLIPLAVYYPSLPDTIPSHFDINGRVNAYGPKTLLLIYPATGLFITLLFQSLCRYPWVFNYPVRITAENASRQYLRGRLLLRWVNAAVWLFGAVQWEAIQAARSATPSFSPAFSTGLLVAALAFPIVLIAVVTTWIVRGR
jgi:uncharacterized membrane protein